MAKLLELEEKTLLYAAHVDRHTSLSILFASWLHKPIPTQSTVPWAGMLAACEVHKCDLTRLTDWHMLRHTPGVKNIPLLQAVFQAVLWHSASDLLMGC